MSKKEKRVMDKAEKAKTITIPMEKVEEILESLEIVGSKLCAVGSCCHGMESAEADGVEIIVREIGYALGEIRDILEEGQGQGQEVQA